MLLLLLVVMLLFHFFFCFVSDRPWHSFETYMEWLKYIERGAERLPRKHLPFQFQLRHDCVFDSAATSWQRCGLAECLHFVDFVSFSLSPCVCLCVFSGVSMILNASMFCLSVCLFVCLTVTPPSYNAISAHMPISVSVRLYKLKYNSLYLHKRMSS